MLAQNACSLNDGQGERSIYNRMNEPTAQNHGCMARRGESQPGLRSGAAQTYVLA
jgi:hypothetical protein